MTNISDKDIAQLARGFVRQHGHAAIALVTGKENEVLIEGNVAGAGICRRLIREIEKLLTIEPASLLLH